MKKFLLLLVGVLFALSADAWTLYVDIKDTGWTSAPYIYCGKLSDTNDYNSNATFFNKYQLSLVYGTIYKWEGSWDNLSIIFFSKEDLGNPSPKNDNDYNKSTYSTKWNGTDAYGAITTNSGGNWTLVDKRLYVLYKGGTNGIASVKDNYTYTPPTTQYSLRGDFTSYTGGKYTWDNNDYTFTPQEDGKTYIYDLSSIGELKDGQTFKIYDFTNKFWYGQDAATISKDTPYTLGTGGDIKVSGAISNPVFTLVVNGSTRTLTITEKPSTPDPEPTPIDQVIYFDAVRSGWGTVTVSGVTATVEDDGTKALKKISYNAAEGAKVTFSNGTATYSVNATNGNVYYVESSSIKDGSAYTNYTPTTYYYRLHGNIFTTGIGEGDWKTQDTMTHADGTYSFTATIKAGSFGIKRLESDQETAINGGNTWINSPTENVSIEKDIEYAAQIKNNNGYDFSTNLNGEYTIVFNPTTMKVKIVSPTVTPKNYVWRLHTNIITGSWPAADNTLADYAMTKQADGVTWVWEGRVSNSGFFGFKRLNEGDKPSNYTPWFYCNNNTNYTVAVNTPTTGKLKNGNSDTSGHDWQWDLTPGRYRISLNATNPDAPVITITALDSDYSHLVYVISGTFNGWTAPGTYLGKESQPFTFVYNSTSKVYEWSYTGTMKNVSFKISNMTDRDTDNDPHWGKAFGYSYKNDGTVADLTPGTEYQMRRTNVPGEDVFIKFQDNDNNPLTLVNPTFTLDPSNMTLVVENHPDPEPTGTYYFLRGYWSGTDETSKALTFVGDGTYVWEGSFGTTSNRFYISKSTSAESDTETDMLTPKKGVYNEFVETGTGTFTAAQTGIKYECLWNTDAGDKTAKWTFGVEGSNLNITTTYRLVFDPEAKTVVIYSLAPVTAHYEALESSSDAGKALGQAVNNLFVELKPSEYLPVEATDSYSLQIGGKVIANGYPDETTEGLYRFDFLPYFVNDQELTLVASESKSADIVVKSAGKIDIKADAGKVWFEGSKYENAWYATIKVPFTTTDADVVYNYPHVTYTRTDQEGSFEANVIWTEGGFTIEVPDAIEVNSDGKYTGKDITFNFKFTPVIPFAVYTAPVASSTSLKAPAADATNLTLQMFGGTPRTYELKINGTTNIDVSGVEGVAVENEDAPVEYYNLQGQRVNGELAPGIYIRRQGNTVTKVRI